MHSYMDAIIVYKLTIGSAFVSYRQPENVYGLCRYKLVMISFSEPYMCTDIIKFTEDSSSDQNISVVSTSILN